MIYEEAMWWKMTENIGNATNIANGTYATYEWTGLDYDTTYYWYATVTDGTYTNTSDTWQFTTGTIGTNFTIWDGSNWVDHTSEDIQFRCTPTQTDCEPTNQDTGSSQSIYRVCNTGTLTGLVYMNMNTTIANIDLKCDDDYTPAGATILTTSNQTIHSDLTNDCIDISCWADYSNPTAGGFFTVNSYVVET
jgi:hypothetical protein